MIPIRSNYTSNGPTYPFGATGTTFLIPGQSQGFLPQDSHHQAPDPNSPEVFKQNLQDVQHQVIQLQEVARRVLAGIQNAYQSGNSPAQTEADINTLKQTLQMIIDMLRLTGVGALPIIASPSDFIAPTEQQLFVSAKAGLQKLYDKLQRAQESAEVAANLIASEQQARPPR